MTELLTKTHRAVAPPLEQDEIEWADVTVDKLVLDGSRIDARIEKALTEATLDRTIEGASTLALTVYDPDREILGSTILLSAVDCKVGSKVFRLVQIAKQGDSITLTFEDREVALLRKKNKPRKATRGKVNRAEFILSLVREIKSPKVKFFCPELHKKQPIKNSKKKKSTSQRESSRSAGFGQGADVKVKGSKATSQQLKTIERVLDAATSITNERSALIACVACITQETVAGKISSNIFQQNPDWPGDPNDPENATNNFLKRATTVPFLTVLKQNKGKKLGWMIDETQRSYTWNTSGQGKDFQQWVKEAERTVKEYGGGSGGSSTTLTRDKKYEFKRGQPGEKEDSWTCIQRLAEEVRWRAFMVGPTLYYISEDDLMRSAPRMSISEKSTGVDNIDFDFDTGKKVQEATVTCRTSLWDAPPGTVVRLKECGPANGKWLVSTISRSLFSTATTITLKQAQKALPEPAPETEDVEVRGSSGGGGSSGGSKDAQDLAKKILKRKNITYQTAQDGRSAGTNTRNDFTTLAKTGKAYCGQTGKSVTVEVRMLQAILDASDEGPVSVNFMTNGKHKDGSEHYIGKAFDTLPGVAYIRRAVEKNGGSVYPEGNHDHMHW